MTKNYVAHRLVIDYLLIICNNQCLINWLPIDYLLITNWFHWCHWCHRLVMSGCIRQIYKNTRCDNFSVLHAHTIYLFLYSLELCFPLSQRKILMQVKNGQCTKCAFWWHVMTHCWQTFVLALPPHFLTLQCCPTTKQNKTQKHWKPVRLASSWPRDFQSGKSKWAKRSARF